MSSILSNLFPGRLPLWITAVEQRLADWLRLTYCITRLAETGVRGCGSFVEDIFRIPGAQTRQLLCVAGSRSTVVWIPFCPPLPPGGWGWYWNGVSAGPVATAGGNGPGLCWCCRKLQPHPCSSILRGDYSWAFAPLTLTSKSIDVSSCAFLRFLFLKMRLLGLRLSLRGGSGTWHLSRRSLWLHRSLGEGLG